MLQKINKTKKKMFGLNTKIIKLFQSASTIFIINLMKLGGSLGKVPQKMKNLLYFGLLVHM
jgi:hypothetical protein